MIGQKALGYTPVCTKIYRAVFETRRQKKIRLARELKEKILWRLWIKDKTS